MKSLPRRFLPILVLAAAAILAAQKAPPRKAAPAEPPKKTALDRATLEPYLRHLGGPSIQMSVSDPTPSVQLPGFFEVKVALSAGGASQEETFLVSPDGEKILKALVFDIRRNPFQSDLEKLKTEFQPSYGTPGAPVVLVQFSDFQCPYCKEEAKILRQNLLSSYPTQVRLYFKDFPLQQLHPWAKPAAIAGRCVFRQNPAAFWDFHDWIFEHQQEITAENLRAKVQEFAQQKSLDVLQLGRCLDTKSTEAEVDRNMAEGRALGLNSIPTLFINGRRVVGQVAWPNLKQIIDYEIEYQKTARNAGEEACCEVPPLAAPAKARP